MSTKKRIEPLAGGAKKKPKSKVVSTLLGMEEAALVVTTRARPRAPNGYAGVATPR
jgi:hypothetical protein